MVEKHLPAGGSVLEINCGSGLDAVHLAQRGYSVHATDVAPGMLQALREKVERLGLEDRLTYEDRSNTELDAVAGAPYDVVFSNLGGLNCTGDLEGVTRHFGDLLKPGGSAVLVVMPPVCPWELLQALRGHFGTAFRRLRRGGVEANVGGSKVHTWYHTPRSLASALGPGFETVATRSLCAFAPPSYFGGFVRRHRRLSRMLMALDDRLGGSWPLRGIGDFYVLVSKKK
jgi:SAM-dependent methyltransferase